MARQYDSSWATSSGVRSATAADAAATLVSEGLAAVTEAPSAPAARRNERRDSISILLLRHLYGPREQRVVFPVGFLQLESGGLRAAGTVGGTRGNRVLARGQRVDFEGEERPGERILLRLQLGRLPRSLVDADIDRGERRAIGPGRAEDPHLAVRRLGHAGDRRFDARAADRRFGVLDMIARLSTHHGDIVAAHEPVHEPRVAQLDSVQPLHV